MFAQICVIHCMTWKKFNRQPLKITVTYLVSEQILNIIRVSSSVPEHAVLVLNIG